MVLVRFEIRGTDIDPYESFDTVPVQVVPDFGGAHDTGTIVEDSYREIRLFQMQRSFEPSSWQNVRMSFLTLGIRISYLCLASAGRCYLPDCFQVRIIPKLIVFRHQRRTQRQRRGGNDPVSRIGMRKVRQPD